MYQHHYSYPTGALKRILKDDDYDEFVKTYKTRKDIIDQMTLNHCSHLDRYVCKNHMIIPNIIRRNLNKNNHKITEYVLKNYGLLSSDITYLIRKFKSIKSTIFRNQIKKLISGSLLYMNFSKADSAYIMNVLFSCKDWDLIDLYHKFGYRIGDINKVINYCPLNKIEKLVDLNYKLNDNSILELIKNYNIYELNFLKKIGFNQKIINDENNKDVIEKLYKYGTLDLVNFLEQNNFKSNETCLTWAVKGYNFEVIKYLRKTFELYEHHIYSLFFIEPEKKKKKTNKKLRRRRFSSNNWRTKRKNRLNGEMIKNKINNYENEILDIVKSYDIDNPLFHDILKKSVDYLILGNCFSLVTYLVQNLGYSMKTIISETTLDDLIRNLIRDDDVKNMKALFQSKIIVPIHISINASNMDLAIKYNSGSMIDYFTNELKMACSPNVTGYLDRYSTNQKEFINNLIKLEFPINNNIIRTLANGGRFDIISNLIDSGHKMPSFVLDYAILHKKYNLFNKLFEEMSVNKKTYIDKIANLSDNYKSFGYRYYYRNGDKFKLNSKRQFECMIKQGCNSKKNITNIFIKNGKFKMAIYLYEVFGYELDPKEILSYLVEKRWRKRIENVTEIIESFEYFEEHMNINIFDDKFPIDSFCSTIVDNVDELLPLFKYVIKKTNIKLNISHMHKLITYSEFTKTDELFELFEEHGIKPDRELLFTAMRDYNMNVCRLLINKYKFTLSLKDIHNCINARNADTDILIEKNFEDWIDQFQYFIS